MNIGAAIAACGIDAREARMLLAEVAGFSQASLIASRDQDLPGPVLEKFVSITEKRKRGEPVAYILGRKEFYGLELSVNPSVLIPRPETELLVDLALEREAVSVLDLGTGSGAIALAVKFHRSNSRVVAVDSDLSALLMAKRNAAKLDLDVDFLHGRWFEPVAGERFDLIVSNPPYVARRDPHLADLQFEPQSALVAGEDGLDAIRDILREAPGYLNEGGWLFLEHGQGQDAAVRDLFQKGFAEVQVWPDLAGIPRVTGGRV